MQREQLMSWRALRSGRNDDREPLKRNKPIFLEVRCATGATDVMAILEEWT